MKKLFIFIAVLSCTIFPMSASSRKNVGFEFGLGSGFVFYGSQKVRNANSSFDASNQIILAADTAVLFPLADSVFFAAGADSTFDFRWKGGDHLNRIDYAGTIGFRIYPGLAGLLLSVDYALGRRTDFISFNDDDENIENTSWGNGFKFGIAYDFTGGTGSYAPVLGVSWRRMPRGGYSDNAIVVSFKVSCK